MGAGAWGALPCHGDVRAAWVARQGPRDTFSGKCEAVPAPCDDATATQRAAPPRPREQKRSLTRSCSHVLSPASQPCPSPGAGRAWGVLPAILPSGRPSGSAKSEPPRATVTVPADATVWREWPDRRVLAPTPPTHLVNSVHLDTKLASKAADGVHLGAVLGELRLVLVADCRLQRGAEGGGERPAAPDPHSPGWAPPQNTHSANTGGGGVQSCPRPCQVGPLDTVGTR